MHLNGPEVFIAVVLMMSTKGTPIKVFIICQAITRARIKTPVKKDPNPAGQTWYSRKSGENIQIKELSIVEKIVETV